MGEYGLNLNCNDRALSPVDFNQLTNNQSLFSPDPLALQPSSTMQDETLHDKTAVKQQQLSPAGQEKSSEQDLQDPVMRKVKAEQENGIHEEKVHAHSNDSMNSVITSLNQLGLSEANAVVNSSLAPPNYWSAGTNTVTDDAFIQSFQPVNGAVTFSTNFAPPPSGLFNTNMTPQMGMNLPQAQQQQQQAQQHRRAITGQQAFAGQRHHQSNQLFLQNNTKTYPTWSSAQQQQHSAWSQQQNQNTVPPWGNIQQRRTVPNLNPIGAPVKKVHPNVNHPMNHSMVISPSKFRRSASYPTQMQQTQVNPKPSFDFSGIDEHRDGNNMFGMHQVGVKFSNILDILLSSGIFSVFGICFSAEMHSLALIVI